VRGENHPLTLPLHQDKKKAKVPPLLAARLSRRNPHLNLVEPNHRRRHVLERLAGLDECSLGIPMPAGEDFDHVDSIERKLEIRGDGFDREALAAARDAHHEDALGYDVGAQAFAKLKQFAPLEQPLLEPLETADLPDAAAVGNVLDDAAA